MMKLGKYIERKYVFIFCRYNDDIYQNRRTTILNGENVTFSLIARSITKKKNLPVDTVTIFYRAKNTTCSNKFYH